MLQHLNIKDLTSLIKKYVNVFHCSNIPLKDQSTGINPYVKLYLLPGKSSLSKRKTKTIKDTSDPIYEATFRYLLSPTELQYREIEVVVASRHIYYDFVHGSSSIIGKVNEFKKGIHFFVSHLFL